MAPWLAEREAVVAEVRFYREESLPIDAGEWDLVIVMGGPMSVNDEAALPWLVEEKRFLREAMAAGVPVLGVCLGAQLIASALGARVYPGPLREIGWFEIEGLPGDGGEHFRFPERSRVFHWHGETFDLPDGAVHLSRSSGCEHQAFQYGARVMGLQCHLEMTPEGVAEMVEHCGADLAEGRFVQSGEAMRQEAAEACGETRALMHKILAYLTR